MRPEAFTFDSLQVAQWQQDGQHDYDQELVGGGPGVGSWLSEQLRRLLNDFFDTTLNSDEFGWLLTALGAIVVAVLAWLLWKRGGRLFDGGEKRGGVDYTVEEDTIYGVDFEAELGRALAQGDYRQAVRWLYLQTLSQLSEAGTIDWQPQKTPTQYIKEVKSEPFSRLSQHFMRVRYGNFEATEPLFREMQTLQRQVREGGSGS